MCSVMAYFGKKLSYKQFCEGFDRTKSRGPDMSKIIDTGVGILGFHRLSIMGLSEEGMQPFVRNGRYVICNGELYGFRPIKEELIKKLRQEEVK